VGRWAARDDLEEPPAGIGKNLDLTVLNQGRGIVIEQITSNAMIQANSCEGKQRPGRLPRAEALAILSGNLPRVTPNTINGPAALMDFRCIIHSRFGATI